MLQRGGLKHDQPFINCDLGSEPLAGEQPQTLLLHSIY